METVRTGLSKVVEYEDKATTRVLTLAANLTRWDCMLIFWVDLSHS